MPYRPCLRPSRVSGPAQRPGSSGSADSEVECVLAGVAGPVGGGFYDVSAGREWHGHEGVGPAHDDGAGEAPEGVPLPGGDAGAFGDVQAAVSVFGSEVQVGPEQAVEAAGRGHGAIDGADGDVDGGGPIELEGVPAAWAARTDEGRALCGVPLLGGLLFGDGLGLRSDPTTGRPVRELL